MKEKFPIVTLCGSSTQKEDWENYQKLLALKGYCVLTINIYLGCEVSSYNEENSQKQLLRELHKQKIRMADVVAIIRKPDGSVGNHTQEEIDYAHRLRKTVFYVDDLLSLDEENLKRLGILSPDC